MESTHLEHVICCTRWGQGSINASFNCRRWNELTFIYVSLDTIEGVDMSQRLLEALSLLRQQLLAFCAERELVNATEPGRQAFAL